MVRPAVVKLVLLLLAVPAQYFISLWMNPNPEQSSVQVLRVVTQLQNFSKKWFNPRNWWKELKQFWQQMTDDRAECVAVEVLKYRSISGHFGNSPTPRTIRPKHLQYHVGQVFLHKSLGYHGIIIGWDSQAKAPDVWLDNHGGRHNAVTSEPHYLVLTDKTESIEIQNYVRQSDIEIVTGRKINNNLISDYFDEFNGISYHPRPFLQKLYPED